MLFFKCRQLKKYSQNLSGSKLQMGYNFCNILRIRRDKQAVFFMKQKKVYYKKCCSTPCDKSLRPLRKTSNISILKLISRVTMYSVRSYWLRAFLGFPRLYCNAFHLLICLQLYCNFKELIERVRKY